MGVRFQLQATAQTACRYGKLYVSFAGGEVRMDTPSCLLYTRYGSVPFLPPDIYETIASIPNIAFIPMFYIAERQSVLKRFKHGIGRFCGIGKRAAFIFQTDPVEDAPVCAADRSSVPVWATGGRIQLPIKEYANCVLASKPDIYQTPTDNETALAICKQSSKKRCSNSVFRTGRYMELLEKEREDHSELKSTPMFISLSGGNDLEWRLSAIKQTDFSYASGIVLDGFCHPLFENLESSPNGSAPESNNQQHLFRLLPILCDHLPSQLPRLLAGIWHPYDVAVAVKSGVDLFDGSLAYRLTRSAMAWVYPGWSAEKPTQLDHRDYLLFPLDDSTGESTEIIYTTPIQQDCKCFSCSKHTKGYISHMHIAKEMLGPMLLMIHNSHQCYRFFEDLRSAVDNNHLDEFIKFTKSISFPADLLAIDRTFESKSTIDSTKVG